MNMENEQLSQNEQLRKLLDDSYRLIGATVALNDRYKKESIIAKIRVKELELLLQNRLVETIHLN